MTLFVDIRLLGLGLGVGHSDRLSLPVSGLAVGSASLFGDSVLGMYQRLICILRHLTPSTALPATNCNVRGAVAEWVRASIGDRTIDGSTPTAGDFEF